MIQNQKCFWNFVSFIIFNVYNKKRGDKDDRHRNCQKNKEKTDSIDWK